MLIDDMSRGRRVPRSGPVDELPVGWLSESDRLSCVRTGHAAVVSALLENYTEIEVDARNAKGITPLIKACVQGKSKCAKLLLAHGKGRRPAPLAASAPLAAGQ